MSGKRRRVFVCPQGHRNEYPSGSWSPPWCETEVERGGERIGCNGPSQYRIRAYYRGPCMAPVTEEASRAR